MVEEIRFILKRKGEKIYPQRLQIKKKRYKCNTGKLLKTTAMQSCGPYHLSTCMSIGPRKQAFDLS